jgi:hypothetical protein
MGKYLGTKAGKCQAVQHPICKSSYMHHTVNQQMLFITSKGMQRAADSD